MAEQTIALYIMSFFSCEGLEDSFLDLPTTSQEYNAGANSLSTRKL